MWTTIDGFAGYEVNDEGAVRNAKTGAQSVQKCCAGKMKTSHGATFEYVSGGIEDGDR